MNICVFCSASEVPKKYNDAAREFATLIGKHGHTLVWGGTDKGTMKVVADVAQTVGAKIIGITFELLKSDARSKADEMVILKTLSERKAEILKRADAIAVLPGGIGTLDELTEMLELKKHGFHNKKIVVLNTDEFYGGFRSQLQRMEAEHFLPRPIADFLFFAATPEEAMNYLHSNT